MARRYWIYSLVIAFVVGAIGSIVFGRFLIPWVATVTGWESLNRLVTNSPIIVNRTTEVQLNEGVNLIDLAKQAGNITVSLYTKETNPTFLGNGVIMTSDGLIFTSKTLVGNRRELTAVLNNGSNYSALVRAVDPKSDIAALTINERNLTVPSFADASNLEAGQRVLIIGESNQSFNRNFAQGYVVNTVANTTTNLWRTFSTEVLEDSFETDAIINNGRFVGSPIINLNGRLVGMVAGGSIQKMVIAENMQTALSSYLATGKIVRPRLGVSYFHLSRSLASLRGLNRAGVLVAKVDDGSPAAGKLLANDLIVEADGENLENRSFEQIINRHNVNEIRFKVLRGNQELDVVVNLQPTN